MRIIEPLDNDLVAPDLIPKKAESSPDVTYPSIDIQAQRSEKVALGQHSVEEDIRREVKYSDMVRINTLIVIPYALSFASIAAILSLPPGTDPASALESRAAMIALTVPAVFPWVFSLFKLRSELWNYKVSFSAFFGLYLLFICPVIDVSIGLLSRGVSTAVILAMTALLSQLYLLAIARSVIKKSFPFVPVIIVVILLYCAVTV